MAIWTASWCRDLLISLGLIFAAFPPGVAHASALDPATAFYVPQPDHRAVMQLSQLVSGGDRTDAALIRDMIETPQAVWLTQGTPKSVLQDVRKTVSRAAAKRTVPVLVAYNLPFRDCSQFGAGGAADVSEYEAWIDAFAEGIGSADALVILEPDALGIIPWYRQFGTAVTYEWCQPADADPAKAAADRFAMLQHAVAALKANPGTLVYLDGTHSAWLGAGDAAHRLVQAGVGAADGFFVNVSEYQANAQLEKYGTWVAKCITFATSPDWRFGHFDWCASQYYPANPSDFSTWYLSDEWYAQYVDSQPGYSEAMLTHFVVDTSRNGQGPWMPPPGVYSDPQTWCNAPDRGLGLRPTANTGLSLVDAYLWVKIPGLSDGQCFRGTSGPLDPARGITDPAAGIWFPEMALELVQNASPPLAP